VPCEFSRAEAGFFCGDAAVAADLDPYARTRNVVCKLNQETIMKKIDPKKLILTKDSVRSLDNANLNAVVGGKPSSGGGCTPKKNC
jgi:hypothetical protein